MGIRSMLRKVFGRDREESPATSVPPQTRETPSTSPDTPEDDARRKADELVAEAFDNPQIPKARTATPADTGALEPSPALTAPAAAEPEATDTADADTAEAEPVAVAVEAEAVEAEAVEAEPVAAEAVEAEPAAAATEPEGAAQTAVAADADAAEAGDADAETEGAAQAAADVDVVEAADAEPESAAQAAADVDVVEAADTETESAAHADAGTAEAEATEDVTSPAEAEDEDAAAKAEDAAEATATADADTAEPEAAADDADADATSPAEAEDAAAETQDAAEATATADADTAEPEAAADDADAAQAEDVDADVEKEVSAEAATAADADEAAEAEVAEPVAAAGGAEAPAAVDESPAEPEAVAVEAAEPEAEAEGEGGVAQGPAVGLAKVKAGAPQLAEAYKAAGTVLKKEGLTGARAAVYLVVDRSGSMRGYFKDGSVQRLAEQTVALAAHLDEEATVTTVFFSTDIDGTVDLAPADLTPTRVEEVNATLGRLGRTNYHRAVEEVLAHHAKGDPARPALVVFQTDGAPESKTAAAQALAEAADRPLQWRFVVWGEEDNKAFDFLRKLDGTPRTAVHFAGVTPVETPHAAFYRGLLTGLEF
ncbi:VWA domain-containing protein [Streptomyces wedmorensis]|uniref:VWA domain-containing protein n=1 Tax=Streptomyces wedmorensis TaxID=43759 RepID=UPI00342069DA